MFNPLAARAVINLRPHMKEGNLRVCEFGNQRLDKSLLRPGIQTTEQWYRANGFERYVALDVNKKMGAQIADLNYPVEYQRDHLFDLVTDNGTGEHLFNQYQVWKNHHDLTEVGGVMLKIMPFTPWYNHGFYNFNPILYRDVAKANEYEWLFFWIDSRNNDPVDLPHGDDSWAFIEKRPIQLAKHAALFRSLPAELYMVAAWKKTQADPFYMPIQGKYKKDIADDGTKQRYSGSAV